MALFDLFKKKTRETPEVKAAEEPKAEEASKASRKVIPPAAEKKPAPAPVKPAQPPSSNAAAPVPPKPAAAPAEKKDSYIGVYKMGVEYCMEYRPDNDLYAVEVHDTSGMFLSDDALSFMLGTLYVAAFALTEEEYALRLAGPGINNPKVNELLDRLLSERPRDRLLTALIVDPSAPSGAQRKPLTFRHQAETIDDHAYQAYRRQRALEHARSLDRVWMSAVFDGRFPAIDAQGYARVFDTEEKAVQDSRANTVLKMSVKAYDGLGFRKEVQSWYGLGITRFRLNPGCKGVSGEIERDEFLPDPLAKKWDYYGSALTQQILRFRQSRIPADDRNFQAMAATMWDAVCHTLPRTVLLVPISFDGDPDSVEDHELHITQGACELLTRLEIERQTGKKLDDSRYVAEDQNGNPLNIARIQLFFGSEGYQFSAGQSGRMMHLRTVKNGSVSMLCGFTDFVSLNAIFRGTARVGAFTFDEITAHLDDAVSDAPVGLHGLVINPAGAELFLARKDIEAVSRIRNEQPKIYSVQEKPKQA